MRVRLHLRLHLRQIATLHLWDVASNAESGLRQIANKNEKKTHSVNGALLPGYDNLLRRGSIIFSFSSLVWESIDGRT